MRFSLIMATVGRTEEVKRFLEHLDRQTYRDFELIVVDQNPDDRLVPILDAYKNRFPILHLRSERGLSRARNVGLRHISGDIVAFPDDDCWYPPDLLERVARFFQDHTNIEGLTGCPVSEKGKPLFGCRTNASGVFLNKFNVWTKGASIAIFLKASAIAEIGTFDETLGLGGSTPWESSEEADYLIRALKKGLRIYHNPHLVIHHPEIIDCYDSKSVQRALRCGLGMGRVWRKHEYPFLFVFYQWLRSAGGVIISLALGRVGKARYHLAALRGKFLGWITKLEADSTFRSGRQRLK